MEKSVPRSVDYPPEFVPTVFADGILNVANSNRVVKVYFNRLDPSLTGSPEPISRPVLQMIMPIEGFIEMAAFLNVAVETRIKDGTFSADLAAAYRAAQARALQ